MSYGFTTMGGIAARYLRTREIQNQKKSELRLVFGGALRH